MKCSALVSFFCTFTFKNQEKMILIEETFDFQSEQEEAWENNEELMDRIEDYSEKLLEYFLNQVGKQEGILCGGYVINTKKLLTVQVCGEVRSVIRNDN